MERLSSTNSAKGICFQSRWLSLIPAIMCASHHIIEILNWGQIKQLFYCCCGPPYRWAGLVHYLVLARRVALQRWTERCSMRSWQINSSLVVGKWKITKQIRVGPRTEKPSFNETDLISPSSKIYHIRAKRQRHDQLFFDKVHIWPMISHSIAWAHTIKTSES